MKKAGIFIGGAAIFVAVALVVSRQKEMPESGGGGGSTAQQKPASSTVERDASSTPSRSANARAKSIQGLPKPVESPHVGGGPENETWVSARTMELDQLSARDDMDSLNQILAEVGNSQPEIRAAALSATRAFGSREAIPWLERISASTSDTAERKAIDETVEYLRLPTMLEHLEENPPEDGSIPADGR